MNGLPIKKSINLCNFLPLKNELSILINLQNSSHHEQKNALLTMIMYNKEWEHWNSYPPTGEKSVKISPLQRILENQFFLTKTLFLFF